MSSFFQLKNNKLIIHNKYNCILSTLILDFRTAQFRRRNYSRATYSVHRVPYRRLETMGSASVPRQSMNWYRYCNNIIDIFSYWDYSLTYIYIYIWIYICDMRAKPRIVFMNVFIHAKRLICVCTRCITTHNAGEHVRLRTPSST